MWNIEYAELFTPENIDDILKQVHANFEIDIDVDVEKFEYFFPEDINEGSEINSCLIKLCRLFMGNLKVKYTIDEEDEQEYELDSVFEKMFVSDAGSQTLESKIAEMANFITEFTEITLVEEEIVINNLLEKEFRSNFEFYKQVQNEIEHFYAYQARGYYMSAFVHLYRAYEYISYAFPLTYIQNTNDFYNSYEQLRSFFGTSDNKGSELLFFERFINKVFLVSEYISEDLYSQSMDISVPTTTYQNIKSTLSAVTTRVNGKLNEINKILESNGASKIEKVVIFDDNTSSIQISSLAVHAFIIELRNKVFHFKAARSDSLIAKHMYFEDLFKIINIHIYNWIAMIFKFILNSAIENRS